MSRSGTGWTVTAAAATLHTTVTSRTAASFSASGELSKFPCITRASVSRYPMAFPSRARAAGGVADLELADDLLRLRLAQAVEEPPGLVVVAQRLRQRQRRADAEEQPHAEERANPDVDGQVHDADGRRAGGEREARPDLEDPRGHISLYVFVSQHDLYLRAFLQQGVVQGGSD